MPAQVNNSSAAFYGSRKMSTPLCLCRLMQVITSDLTQHFFHIRKNPRFSVVASLTERRVLPDYKKYKRVTTSYCSMMFFAISTFQLWAITTDSNSRIIVVSFSAVLRYSGDSEIWASSPHVTCNVLLMLLFTAVLTIVFASAVQQSF